MERRPVYSIFPAPPTSLPPQHQPKPRQSAESRTRPSLEKPPYPPPSAPLPPVPTSPAPTSLPVPTSPPQVLPPTPESLRPVKLPSRRRVSPNREFADFQRELAQSTSSSQKSPRLPSPARGRPTSPKQRPPSKQSHHKPPSGHSRAPSDPPDHDMQNSTLSTSSTSSLSLAKPPMLSPTTTVAPTPPLSATSRTHRPSTVYFHGSIGGAGNYRKVIRENNKAPRAYAENANPPRRASPTRFLSHLLGNQKGGRSTEAVFDERASGSEESVREEVDLGAAEALRRKMMGLGRKKK